jgi:hypothetical protein
VAVPASRPINTFAAQRVHGPSAIPVLTAQHTRGVTAVNVPPMDFPRGRLDSNFADFKIQAVRPGISATSQAIGVVADAVRAHRSSTVVVNPAMVAGRQHAARGANTATAAGQGGDAQPARQGDGRVATCMRPACSVLIASRLGATPSGPLIQDQTLKFGWIPVPAGVSA